MSPAMTRSAPIRAENEIFSAAKQKRSLNAGNLLPWPVSLALVEVSPFLHAEQLSLFSEDGEIDVASLREKQERRSVQLHAGSTIRAYDAGWRDFQIFCRRTGRAPLPAMPSTVTLYLTYEATQHLAAGTITRRLVAISERHTLAGHPTPCADPQVRNCLKGIRREIGTAPHPKTPISADDLKSMLESAGNSVRGLRDRALLALGFASGCRRAELVALNLDDAAFEPQGIRIRIRRSKTDRDGQGQEAAAHRGHRKATCPVRALQAWIAARGRQPGPLFVRVLKTGKVTAQRLTGRAVARVVKRMARAVGLDERQYAGHSLRAGCATSASAAGADVVAIQRRLRHANVSTTSKYIRHGSLFICDPLEGVL